MSHGDEPWGQPAISVVHRPRASPEAMILGQQKLPIKRGHVLDRIDAEPLPSQFEANSTDGSLEVRRRIHGLRSVAQPKGCRHDFDTRLAVTLATLPITNRKG